MLNLCHRSQLLHPVGRVYRLLSAQNLPADNDETYTEQPKYPDIKELSFRAKKQRNVENWHEEIRCTPTVEEKLIKTNMPRYYGYKVVKLSDERFPYNSLPVIQHYTRTIFDELSDKVKDLENESSKQFSNDKPDSIIQNIKTEVQDALEFSNDFFKHKYVHDTEMNAETCERLFSQIVIEQINRLLLNILGSDNKHLNEMEVDITPRHEAFWQVGGINPPRSIVKSKESHKWQKEMANDPIDRLMQYKGNPYLALRHCKQLTPWKSTQESKNLELAKQIPRFNYDPRSLGFLTDHQHVNNIPGYWPGTCNNFGFMSYQSRAHLQARPDSYGAEDFKEVLHAEAILSSYSWLLAQANYNGFNTFNDITYPMNTQTIITNGRDWSFYEYQLNTLLIHSNHVNENPLVNFCRGTNQMQLFQEFDQNGNCVGFNDNVLCHLVKFYKNSPTITRSTSELQPYLDAKYKVIADYPDADQRTFLENTFKHLASNRPRHLEIPEIYLWEKIYKIDNKTRPMEAKRRFFELGINPWKRTLDQHQKEYIPRSLRLNGPKDKKNKWKKMYYP